LGGLANFALDYATKRYRSNLLNWGILPFVLDGGPAFGNGDYVFIPRVRGAVAEAAETVDAFVVRAAPSPDSGGFTFSAVPFTLKMPALTPDEKEIVLAGSLINYSRANFFAAAAAV
jgi:aconitate hydratase